ncbi:hypothetical protein ACSFBI_33515 [Variovorax sp. RB3P1]|uniref:hypothetical protein n=1 Tax=Variovorax sp. RB3P1 TaxID=3443732 RepID=UPI003F45A7B8
MGCARILVGLLFSLALCAGGDATTLDARIQEVTVQNASDFSLQIHVTQFQATCDGVQVWASIPAGTRSEAVFSASMQLRSEENNMVLNVPLPIVDHAAQPDILYMSPAPTYVPEQSRHWMEERRREHAFLVHGFRGVSFCLAPKFLPRASLAFESGAVVYHVAPLSDWNKKVVPSR